MLLDAAIHQNAAWCDLVCRRHGLATAWTDRAWTCATRAPELYPDAVTLHPDLDVAAMLERIDARPGCSVKDSFATIDLEPYGFDVLFEATWVMARGDGSTTTWLPLVVPADLAAWRSAWIAAGGVPGVLEPSAPAADTVTFVGHVADGMVDGGGVLHADADVVAASNLFGRDPWRHVIGSVADGTTVVGYETGDDLAAALAAGATALGPLRVWVRRASGG